MPNTVQIKVTVDTSAARRQLDELALRMKLMGGAGGGLGGVAGGAGGAGGGAGALGSPIAVGIGAGTLLGAPVIGATLGLAGFAAVALPTLSKISTALTATGTAGKKAWAALDPGQFALAKEIQSVGSAFTAMAKSLEPVVAQGLTPLLRLARDLIPSLKPLAQAGAQVLAAFFTPLDQLVSSGFFAKFIQTMAAVGVQFAKLFGPELASILKSVLSLIMNLAPASMQLWRALGPLVTLLVKEFAQALSQVLPPLIRVLAQTFKAITPLIPPLTKLWMETMPPLIKIISKLTIDVLPVVAWVINRVVIPALNMLIQQIKPVADAISGFVRNWRQDWHTVSDIIVTIWDNIVAFFSHIPSKVWNAISGLGPLLRTVGHNAMHGFFEAIKNVASNILSWLGNLVGKIGGIFGHIIGLGGGGGSGGGGSPSGGNARQNKALARTMFPWGASQWASFNNIAMAESGYNQFAENPSGAYGIPQALPASKMPFAAQKAGGSDPTAQLHWMFSYIAGRYGNPNNAWAFHQSHNWYAGGGPASGWVGVGDRGRELIKLPTGSHVYSNPDTERMLGGGGGGTMRLIVGMDPQMPHGFARELIKFLKFTVRTQGGGDVQAAFGGYS